jgi:hypothetical protein
MLYFAASPTNPGPEPIYVRKKVCELQHKKTENTKCRRLTPFLPLNTATVWQLNLVT